MIYDCFIYYNETDLLKIRCEEMKSLDVTHVLVENKYDFSGKEKGFHLDLSQYAEYNIAYLCIQEHVEMGDYFKNEICQRNMIKQALEFFTNVEDDDIVIISDIDEIPKASEIKDYALEFGFVALQMDKFNYYFNCKEKTKWDRARLMPYRYLKDKTPDEVRNSGYDIVISNAGHHFSWLGNWYEILEKLRTTHHQEYNTPDFIQQFKKFYDNQEFFVTGEKMNIVPVDHTYPKYIQDNKDGKYKHLIL